MSEVKMTVQQIMDLGLWEKVCEYKGWNIWIVNEGKMQEDEIVEFDTTFPKDTRTPAQKLAEELHKELCGWNHTDGCGWYYENSWDEWTHEKYLKKAEELLELGVDIRTIFKIIKIVNRN